MTDNNSERAQFMNEDRSSESLSVSSNFKKFQEIKNVATVESNSALDPYMKKFKEKTLCSYYIYGNVPIYQRIYYCETCDPNHTEKICEDCYNYCHQECDNGDSDAENEDLITEHPQQKDLFGNYICDCGKKKHILNKKIEETQRTKCNFLELDMKLHNTAVYSCETCNVRNLCYICYLKCHGKFSCATKKKITNNPNVNENKICLCKHDNHSSKVVLNKFMNNIFNSKCNYDTIPFVWKSQILNCVFDGDIYQLLYEKMYTYIYCFDAKVFDAQGIDEITVDTLSRFVINVSKTKKFYYLHHNLIKVLPMNKLLMIINSFSEGGHFVKYANFLSGIINLLLILHFKKDFQSLKSMCYKDFLLTNTLDRINMKKRINTISLYTKKIFDKYYDSKRKKFLLSQICLSLTSIMTSALNEFNENYSIYINSYIVIMQTIYFCVKRFLFSKDEIISITDSLEKFCTLFHGKILSKEMKEVDVSKMISYISKITYVLMVNYNDLIIEEMLVSQSEINDKFIHSCTTHSKKLFKIMVATSLVFNTFTLENFDNYTNRATLINLINFVNQSLEMFTLSDNLYYRRLDEVTNDDVKQFEKVSHKIDERTQFEESLVLSFEKKSNFGSANTKYVEEDEYSKAYLGLREKSLVNCIVPEVYNIYERLESLLKLFFYSKIDYVDIDEKYYEILFSFGKDWDMENMLLGVHTSNKQRKKYVGRESLSITKRVRASQFFGSMPKDFLGHAEEAENTNQVNTKSISIEEFHEMISKVTKELFPIINDDLIADDDKVNEVIDELIYSSIDNTLTKLFLLDPERKRYSERTVNIIFTFLMIFALNKKGLKHLLIGRNLGRIKDIFWVYPKITLNFLSIITKGIYVYDLDMSDHKQIPLILKDIYKFVKKNIDEESMNSNKNNIYECIISTMEILFYLSINFEIEYLTKINILIVDELKKILTKKKIISSFPFSKLIAKYIMHFNVVLDSENEEEEGEKKYLIADNDEYDLNYLRGMYNDAKMIDGSLPNMTPIIKKQFTLIEDENLLLTKVNKYITAFSPTGVIEVEPTTRTPKSFGNAHLTSTEKNKTTTKRKVASSSRVEEDKNTSKPPISDESRFSLLGFETKTLYKNQRFFFSLIRLLSNITYFFVIQNNTLTEFENVNDLFFFKSLLEENYISLKDRTTLLVYIRMVYISDQIDSNGSLALSKYLNSIDYADAIENLRIVLDDKNTQFMNVPESFVANIRDKKRQNAYGNMLKNDYIKKLESIHNLKLVLEIFIHELRNCIVYSYSEENKIDVNEYIRSILFSVKIISDVFITYDICSHLTLWFYELTKEFICKVNFFITFINTNKLIDIPCDDEVIQEMENKNFDIYDKEKLYGILLEKFQKIYNATNFNKNFKLNSFIINYVNTAEINFKDFTLNQTEIPFFAFFLENAIKPEEKEINVAIESVKSTYLMQFNNFFDTAFYDLICCPSYETSINCNEVFLNYTVVYIFNIKSLPSESMVTFLTMLNKLLIYEPTSTQNALTMVFKMKNVEMSNTNVRRLYEELFFSNLASILQEKININIATCKNIVIYKRYEKINTTTKILIQFFQLLGEGHNKNFHNLIISGMKNFKPNNIGTDNTFCIMVKALGHIIKSFDSYQNLIMKGELPFDKLIVMTKNIIDFIIEFFQGTSIEKYKIMYAPLTEIFPQIHSFLFFIPTESDEQMYEEKRIMIYMVKIYLLELISSLIEEGNADDSKLGTLSNIVENFPPIELYDDAVRAFQHLIKTNKNLKDKKLDESIIPTLVEMYKYDDTFQNSLDLKWALKVFYYVRILSDVYDRAEVTSFLKNIKSTDPSNYAVYEFLQKLLTRIEIKEIDNESTKDFSFFVIPSICFLLSSRTQLYFNKYVNRESVHSKITNLINETDFFMYEMFFNNFYFRHYSALSKMLSYLNIRWCEIVNYIFVLIENVFLITEFYSRETPIPDSEKEKRNTKNMIIAITHIFFIVVVVVIWLYYVFRLEFVHNIMRSLHIKFFFRANDDKTSHFSNLSEEPKKLLNKVTSGVSIPQQIKIMLFNTLLFNRQINMLLGTLLCIIIYLITGNGIPLTIPVLFLANMNELLFGIILAFKLRWSKFLFVLIYTYLIVYIFAILGFYYFNSSFDFDELLDVKNGTKDGEEQMCSSLIQCYLTLLSYGVRSGGGIGDVIIKFKFTGNVGGYVSRFFFDVLFHIIIILIMTNLIFGIIVDSFAELRNKNNENSYDKSNVCFICQITRDSAMNKNIDFDNHRETVHNLWNYVYFLTYLHINNSNNFKMLESSVWNKIYEMDTSWIPISEKEDKPKESDDSAYVSLNTNMIAYFVVRSDIYEDVNKMLNATVNGMLQINENMRVDETLKKNVALWAEQGKKKNFISVSALGLKALIEQCDSEKFPYIKLEDDEMIILGPDDEKILRGLIAI